MTQQSILSKHYTSLSALSLESEDCDRLYCTRDVGVLIHSCHPCSISVPLYLSRPPLNTTAQHNYSIVPSTITKVGQTLSYRSMSAGHFKNPIGQITGHFGTRVRNTDTYRIQIWILYPYICHLYPNWLATLAKNLASLAIGQLTWTYSHKISGYRVETSYFSSLFTFHIFTSINRMQQHL